MKKITVVLLALLLVITGCTKASDKDAVDGSKKKVTVWAWDESFNIRAAEEAKKLYDNEDVEIEIVTMAQADIVQKLNTSLSSGTTAGLPNIVLIEDYKIQGYLTSYPGEFANLDSIVKDEDFASYKLAVTQKDGTNYGVPFDSGVVALFYRLDILEEAGFTSNDMEDLTWEEFLEISKVVHEKTGKQMITLNPSNIEIIKTMMQSAGTWYVDQDGEKVYLKDNEDLKNALEIYKEIVDANITKTISSWDEYIGAFNNGDVYSEVTGAWIASSIKRADDQSGKWAVATAPRMGNSSKSVNRSNAGGSSWYILENVENKEEAMDFLGKTFASSLELMDVLAKEISLVSSLKEASTMPNYDKPDPFFSDQKTMSLFAEWLVDIPSVNYGYNTYVIEGILQAHVLEYLNGNKTLDEVLEAAQAEAESAIME